MGASLWSPGTTTTITPPTADIPMGGFKLTGLGAGIVRSDSVNYGQTQDSNSQWGGTSTGSANTQAITLTPAITAYKIGQSFKFIAGFTNSGPTTINVNGVGAIAAQSNVAAMGGGEIIAGVTYEMVLDTLTTCQILKVGADITAGSASDRTMERLISLIYPSADNRWKDIYRAGWLPYWFNQQWGGAQVGFELLNVVDDILYNFDSAANYVDSNSSGGIGASIADAAARTYIAQGFKVSESQSISALWVKINKVGNPTNNLTVRILPDDGTGTKPTGNTPVTNGTATAQSGKLHGSYVYSEWVRFVFPIAPALVAGTVYHIVLSSSGAVDASNYWSWQYNDRPKKYPFGNYSTGSAVPVWAATTTIATCFIVENAVANGFLQDGGIFDKKVVFVEGSPINQSKALSKKMFEFYDGKSFTCLVRGTFIKGKPIADFSYGIDHDRINIKCNSATGFAEVNLYNSSGTRFTVTATSVDLSVGSHDVAILARTVGDGADYLKLFVDGVSTGTPLTAQTFLIDNLLKLQGTAILGGGFDIPSVFPWTHSLIMSALPSTLGWTWTGIATEANAMSVSGSILYQNATGYTALQDGYYLKAGTLSNANGWTVAWKNKTSNSSGTAGVFCASVTVLDGAKSASVNIQPNFVEVFSISSFAKIHQNNTVPHAYVFSGKGSDFYLWCDGKLIFDGTGLMTGVTATNQIWFGDSSVTSGENSDVLWNYVKYYNTAIVAPIFGGSMSEFAYWSGDKSTLLPTLYNSGSQVSVKQYCGSSLNYAGAPARQTYTANTIVLGATTVAPIYAPIPDLGCYAIGSEIEAQFNSGVYNPIGVNNANFVIRDNGSYKTSDPTVITADVAQNSAAVAQIGARQTYLGLHKIEVNWATNGGTLTQNIAGYGQLSVKASSFY